MLHEKALKAFGEPNLGSRRIFDDKISTMFNLVKSDSGTKILPWEDTFSFSDKYLMDH